MASTTDGLNATAPNLQADIGNPVALGGLEDDLLAVPQFNGSGAGLSAEQADSLVQSYVQLYDSQVPTLAAELEPVSSSELTAEAMDVSDDLTGLSLNAPVITFNLPTDPSSLEPSAATTSFNFGTGTENNLGTILGEREYSDRSPNTWFNVYSFSVNSDSALDLSLENYSGHQNLFLLNDYDPGSFSFDMGQILAHSDSRQAQPNRLSGTLHAGDYHAVVLSPTAHLGYQLNVNTDPLGGIEHIQGGLTADNWEFEGNTRYTVYSGEGNVNFGQGEFDLIDFSHYSLDDVIGWNPVTPDGGGMPFDNGNGLRLFDAMQLNDGHNILFEGIDRRN